MFGMCYSLVLFTKDSASLSIPDPKFGFRHDQFRTKNHNKILSNINIPIDLQCRTNDFPPTLNSLYLYTFAV